MTSEHASSDLLNLKHRAAYYAEHAGASIEAIGLLQNFLESSLAHRLLAISEENLNTDLIVDAYKPKMHNLYGEFFTGVEADFILNIRSTPFPLERIQIKDPELFQVFQAKLDALSEAAQVTDRSQQILRDYFNFNTSQATLERACLHAAAQVEWQTQESGKLLAVARGPIDAASIVETSVTQAVQEVTVSAQLRELSRQRGKHVSATEQLANSLGYLAFVYDRLSRLGHPMKLALFAGRRSTSRRFLLLQTAFCAAHLPGYIGTSSIFAVGVLDASLQANGVTGLEDRKGQIGSLIGTHAHEVMSVTSQLLSCWDDRVLSDDGGPVALSALLAHLLFLTANGGLSTATALADTFGTKGFLAAAEVASLPSEFVQDMRTRYGDDGRIPAGSVVFDIVKVWRIDSGDYAEISESIVQTWERRCSQLGPGALEKPALMNSNLSTVEEIEEAARLPERIRPAVCAFGGLADRFVRFDLGDGGTAEIGLANVVMKAVQARRDGLEGCMPGAGKLGDDGMHGKIQVDARLPPEQQAAVKQRMLAMSQQRRINAESASRILAEMYHKVTRERILCQQLDRGLMS